MQTSHIPAFFQRTSKCLDMFLTGTKLSLLCIIDVTVDFYSAIIRLTGRGHHYDRLQRERRGKKTTCLAFEIQFHRRLELIPLTPVNRHILIIMSPSHISCHVWEITLIEMANSCHPGAQSRARALELVGNAPMTDCDNKRIEEQRM